MILLVFFSLLEIFLSGAFIFMFVRGETNEYLLGGLMAMQLLSVAMITICYYRTFVSFREISEDREEEYLW